MNEKGSWSENSLPIPKHIHHALGGRVTNYTQKKSPFNTFHFFSWKIIFNTSELEKQLASYHKVILNNTVATELTIQASAASKTEA